QFETAGIGSCVLTQITSDIGPTWRRRCRRSTLSAILSPRLRCARVLPRWSCLLDARSRRALGYQNLERDTCENRAEHNCRNAETGENQSFRHKMLLGVFRVFCHISSACRAVQASISDTHDPSVFVERSRAAK